MVHLKGGAMIFFTSARMGKSFWDYSFNTKHHMGMPERNLKDSVRKLGENIFFISFI